MTTTFDEEPWEAEVGAALGRLPPVEPPDGFIDAALDHRPLHAGRTLSALVALTVAAAAAVVATGLVGSRGVTVEPDEVAQRHTAVEVSVLGTGAGSGGRAVDDRPEPSLELPDDYEAVRTLVVDDVTTTVYEGGDGPVTVSVQAGKVRWDDLPSAGLTDLGGRRAWFDADRQLTVVQVGDDILTIVGLGAAEVRAALASAPGGRRSWWDRAQDTAAAVSRQLGYPDVGALAGVPVRR